MSDAAFQATYSDLKVIKSRKVAQVILEVPLEQANHAMEVLGGLPRPDAETWVAVARLVKEADSPPDSKPKEKTEGERAVIRAVMLCRDESFWKFLRSIRLDEWRDAAANCDHADENETVARLTLYRALQIGSRSVLLHDGPARQRFHKLDNEYKDWLRYGDKQ